MLAEPHTFAEPHTHTHTYTCTHTHTHTHTHTNAGTWVNFFNVLNLDTHFFVWFVVNQNYTNCYSWMEQQGPEPLVFKGLMLGSRKECKQYLFVLSRSTSVGLGSGLAGSTPYAPLDVHGRTSVWTPELGQNAENDNIPLCLNAENGIEQGEWWQLYTYEHWKWDRIQRMTTVFECWKWDRMQRMTTVFEYWKWDRMQRMLKIINLCLNTRTGIECWEWWQ